jgi:hypothetical protein
MEVVQRIDAEGMGKVLAGAKALKGLCRADRPGPGRDCADREARPAPVDGGAVRPTEDGRKGDMMKRVHEVWETSLVETLTHRGFERRWVEPGSKVVVGGWRTRVFTQDEWAALFPPNGRDWGPVEAPCPTRRVSDPGPSAAPPPQ